MEYYLLPGQYVKGGTAPPVRDPKDDLYGHAEPQMGKLHRRRC